MLIAPEILAQSNDAAGYFILFLWIIVFVLLVAGWWRVFSKAGIPGFVSIIPIVNMYYLCKIAGRPGWWVLLLFIPIVSLIIAIVLSLDVAKAFGKGPLFAVGLILLPFIFYPLLGFGSAEYQGPAAAGRLT
jgi:hypothetical protein